MVVDVLVAGTADDKGLAAAGGHPQDPLRLWFPPVGVEIFQRPDVMHFDLVSRSAEFAGIGQEPLDQFRQVTVPDAWRVVVEGPWCDVARQADAAPFGHQWRSSALAVDDDAKTASPTMLGIEHGNGSGGRPEGP